MQLSILEVCIDHFLCPSTVRGTGLQHGRYHPFPGHVHLLQRLPWMAQANPYNIPVTHTHTLLYHSIIHILVHSQMHSVPQSLSLMHPLTHSHAHITPTYVYLCTQRLYSYAYAPSHTLAHTQSLISTYTRQVHAPSLVLP